MVGPSSAAEVRGVPETSGLMWPATGALVGMAVLLARTVPVEIATDPVVGALPDAERTV